jgi:hypothetical protein
MLVQQTVGVGDGACVGFGTGRFLVLGEGILAGPRVPPLENATMDQVAAGSLIVGGSSVTLVCEGICNPDLATVDAWMARERVKMEDCRDGKTIGLSGPVTTALRRLVHTPHRRVGPGEYACCACGARRRYGNG